MENIEQNSRLQNRSKIKVSIELFVVLALSIVVFMISAQYQLLEKITEFSHRYEDWEIDEFIVVSIFLLFVLTFVSLRQWRRVRTSEKELLHINKEIQKAFAEIKQLRGIIPICASCKKIRDDSGFWQQVEVYVREHTEAEFSHGICPDCARNLYPGLSSHVENRIKNKDKSSS